MKRGRGVLFGVSVGPGDPELLTVKAVRIIQDADVIAAPSIGGKRRTALDIVSAYVEGKEVVDCSTPMLRDRAAALKAYDEAADRLAALLDQGKCVAFVCLGDVGVYSTYYYVHDRLASRGYDCRVIPGVTSFCAAAAELGRPLCEGPERLTVVPVIAGDVDDCLEVPGTKVFMKSGKDLARLQERLTEAGCVHDAAMVANCGLEDQAVYPDFADVPAETEDYFSLVILG